MSEKRGYPNPDYMEHDMLEQINASIMIDDQDYRAMVGKSYAMDLLRTRIEKTGKVEEDVVYALTAASDAQEESEARQYERWWREETSKSSRLDRENKELKAKLQKLEEQINQLLPAMEEEPKKKEDQNE